MGLPIKDELAREEAIIERGMMSFVEVGNALMRIRDNDLYTVVYDTFEAYCKDRWGFTSNYAKRLVRSAETMRRLEAVPIGTLPATENQTRPLTSLPEDQQLAAWKEAVETAPGGKVTAKHVNNVVNIRRGADKTKKKKRLPTFKPDTTGLKIGSQAMHYAETALLHLKQISKDDPEITKALRRVISFCKSKIKEVCSEQKAV